MMQSAPEWRYYRAGKVVPVTEYEARHAFDHWGIRSDERGAALILIGQMWAEIDRLRSALDLQDAEAVS